MRLSALLLLATSLVACSGDSPTTPDPSPVGAKSLVQFSGNNQIGTVVAPLGEPLVARAYIDTTHGANTARMALIPLSSAKASSDTVALYNLGPALKNTLISFVVPDPDFGRAFAGAAITDSLGIAKDRWEAGKKAGCSTMEARMVDQSTGAPITVATFVACFNPGPVTWAYLFPFPNGTLQVSAGDSVNIRQYVNAAQDQYGNVSTTYTFQWKNQCSDPSLSDTDLTTSDVAVAKAGCDSWGVYLDGTYFGQVSYHIAQ